MRKRPIKKYGNTYVITLTRADIKDFELEEGDEVDIDELIFIKKKKRKKK